MKECVRCLLRESAEEDTWRTVQDRVNAIPTAERTGEEEYAARLEACRRCGHLISGVCMKCGCYVEFRAAYRRMGCPDVRERHWMLSVEEKERGERS